jgi:hypothetical protein
MADSNKDAAVTFLKLAAKGDDTHYVESCLGVNIAKSGLMAHYRSVVNASAHGCVPKFGTATKQTLLTAFEIGYMMSYKVSYVICQKESEQTFGD